MLVIMLMVAGVAMIVGLKDFAGKAAKGVLTAILILAIAPCLLRACCCSLANGGEQLSSKSWTTVVIILLLCTLPPTGFVAWRRRSDRAKAHEIWAKRNGAPRVRSLPAPPQS